MPRVKPEHYAARREQILAAAASCFSRSGFHKTSMQDIIAESGLSAGAIYNYFSGKDEIIEAIASARHVAEQAALAHLGDGSNASQTLKALARYFAGALVTKEGQRARRVGVFAWAEALLNPQIAKSMREGLAGPREAIAALVKEGQRAGNIDPGLSPDALARAFIAMFHGFVLQMLWDKKTPQEEMMAVFEAIIDAVVSSHAGREGDLKPIPSTPG